MPQRLATRRVAIAIAAAAALALLLSGVAVVLSSVVPGAPQASAATFYAPPPLRERVDLDKGWRFHLGDAAGAQGVAFDDSTWEGVDTPHTWNAVDGSNGDSTSYQGIGWYRRQYAVPAGYLGKKLFLDFAGANQVADVWVNGVQLGEHKGGYSRFRFDATGALHPGPGNVIAVRVDNAYNPDIAPLSGDFTMDGGLYRDVCLWAVDPLEVQLLDDGGPGVYLRQRELDAASASVDVTTKLANGGATSRSVAVRTIITDRAGEIVVDATTTPRTLAGKAGQSVTQSLALAHPHRWDGIKDPYLYRVAVEVRDADTNKVTDDVTQSLGLRTMGIDPDAGFFLNGRHLPLHGVSLHQDYAGVGWAETPADHVKDFSLISEMGANAIRMAHYQHDQMDYDLADQQGFVVWAEVPLVNSTIDTPAFTASTERQLRELIVQNFNHPSIAFWSTGNEQSHDNAPTNALLGALAKMVHQLDPDRFSTYANCCVGDYAHITDYSDANAYNVYFGWYTNVVTDLGPWIDGIHATKPDRKIGISEYGAGANPSQHALNPTTFGPQFHPEEFQDLYHEQSWKQIAARPYIWGSFVWNMFDFAADKRNEGGQPGINDKGLVTRDRKTRKDAFYWYKANWASTPTLYITSRRWTVRVDASTELKVYSNATTVTATLNGSPLGTRTADDHIFKWTGVTLRPGPNTVKVTATIDGAVQSDTVTWTLSAPTG